MNIKHEGGTSDGESDKSSDIHKGTLWQLAVSCVGLILVFLFWGVLQERITFTEYREGTFHHTKFLSLVQCIIATIAATGTLIYSRIPLCPSPAKVGPTFLMMSVAYSVGAEIGYCSDSYINFPTKVLAKSSKMVPVMLMGTIFDGKKYSLADYTCAGLVAGGISMFVLCGRDVGDSVNSTRPPLEMFLGIMLVVINLTLDGFTYAKQEKVMRVWHLGPRQAMLWMNIVSILVYGIWAFVFSSEGYTAIVRCLHDWKLFLDIVLFSLCGSVGQHFVYYIIHLFGSLTNTYVCNMRKFLTILLSVMWFGHSLQTLQWVAVVIVFAGLFWHVQSKSKNRAYKKSA